MPVISSSGDPYLFSEWDRVVYDKAIDGSRPYYVSHHIVEVCNMCDIVYVSVDRIDLTGVHRPSLYRCEVPILDILRLYCADGGFAGLSIVDFVRKVI